MPVGRPAPSWPERHPPSAAPRRAGREDRPSRDARGALASAGFVLAAAIVLLGSRASWAEGDPERGRRLAIENCAQCHVIGAYNPHGGVNNSPSFYIFSERPEVYRERLRTFDQRRPHLSRDMQVTAADIGDIMAYVETLERP